MRVRIRVRVGIRMEVRFAEGHPSTTLILIPTSGGSFWRDQIILTLIPILILILLPFHHLSPLLSNSHPVENQHQDEEE